jgi:hypothetical protein
VSASGEADVRGARGSTYSVWLSFESVEELMKRAKNGYGNRKESPGQVLKRLGLQKLGELKKSKVIKNGNGQNSN